MKTYMVISRSAVLRMRNSAGKFLEKSKTHILCPITFFPDNRTVYKTMWKSMVEPGRPQMTVK